MTVKKYIQGAFLVIGGLFLAGCGASGNDQGLEYAPNMYHSVPYEPLSQIMDPESGSATQMLSDNSDEHGEYYNSNPLNPNNMTMRVPPANTVPRGKYLPYRVPKDSLTQADEVMNPLEATDAMLADGGQLYQRFCDHCHGGAGQGPDPGTVGEVFAGVPAYNSAAVKDLSAGRIYHAITNGKGRMGAHGSQISPEDRWKIVMFVQTLQKQ